MGWLKYYNRTLVAQYENPGNTEYSLGLRKSLLTPLISYDKHINYSKKKKNEITESIKTGKVDGERRWEEQGDILMLPFLLLAMIMKWTMSQSNCLPDSNTSIRS